MPTVLVAVLIHSYYTVTEAGQRYGGVGWLGLGRHTKDMQHSGCALVHIITRSQAVSPVLTIMHYWNDAIFRSPDT